MRVLVVHNRYSSRVPSGENLAVHDEVGWLREAGIDVHTHEVTNDDLVAGSRTDQIRRAVETTWSPTSRRQFLEVVDRVGPQIVHVHNLFPLLTASVPKAALRRELPIVWTVHNRRVTCVKGGHFRDDAPCHRCHIGWRAPGIWLGCYADSRSASALVTAATSIFRRVARRQVTALAISEHMKQWLTRDAGFPAARVHVKYNGVADSSDGEAILPPTDSRTFLFVGRLSDNKGISLLLDAWKRVGRRDLRLRIIGDGTLAPRVEEAAASDLRIDWVGHVPASDVPSHIGAARAVVVPSTWEEPFGRVAAEASAHGRPVITTGRGGLGEIVDDRTGWITGVDAARMASAIEEAASDDAVGKRADPAYDRYKELFSPEATTQALLQIYERVLRAHRDAAAGPAAPDGQVPDSDPYDRDGLT